MGTLRILDLAPLGRNEETPGAWWHRHDEYDAAWRKTMRIFLAGASGVIGVRLIPLLVSDGHEVAGIPSRAR